MELVQRAETWVFDVELIQYYNKEAASEIGACF
jgi:hypothetical protein